MTSVYSIIKEVPACYSAQHNDKYTYISGGGAGGGGGGMGLDLILDGWSYMDVEAKLISVHFTPSKLIYTYRILPLIGAVCNRRAVANKRTGL